MLEKYTKPLTINGITLDYTQETFIMGILNVTPDSFSDGGSITMWRLLLLKRKKWWLKEQKLLM